MNLLANPGKSKKQVLKEAGYSDGMAKNPQDVIESVGYKEAAKPFVEQMEEERQRLIDSMKTKSLDEVGYRDHVASVDTFTKNIQLLSGRATERAEVRLNPEREAEIRRALGEV